MSSAFSFLFISDWLTWFSSRCVKLKWHFWLETLRGWYTTSLIRLHLTQSRWSISYLSVTERQNNEIRQVTFLSYCGYFSRMLSFFSKSRFWIWLGVIFIPPQHFYFWACFSLPRLQTELLVKRIFPILLATGIFLQLSLTKVKFCHLNHRFKGSAPIFLKLLKTHDKSLRFA